MKEQKANLETELRRVKALLADSAATVQQFDQLTGQIKVTDTQIDQVRTQNSGVLSELEAFDFQIAQIDDMLRKCQVVNPVHGVVLGKYFEPGELVFPGRPLYKIADMSALRLRVYVSGAQLGSIHIGKTVEVYYDAADGGLQRCRGEVVWISAEAEFTPKVIQTREERVNLVYAVNILVENSGDLKIGMPGEVVF